MGKHLIKSEESTQIHKVNQGCMWGGMFNILDYHQWGVKRVFHHKKKRHDRYKRKTTLQDQQNVVTEAESHLVSQQREISNAKGQASSENELHQKKDGNTTETSLKRDISIKFKNNDDVLEVISVEKNLLLKYLRDIDFGGKKNHKASLTKSGSFPLPASSKTKNISSSTFRAKQTEIWDFPKGEKLRAGTQVPKKFGSSSVKDISYETPKPSVTDFGIDSVIAVEQKSSISSRSSDGLNHKGWNQVVIHQFKIIKQKIKHAIVELKKSGHSKTSPEYSIIDNEKEISQSLDDGANHEYRKSKSLSETKAFESGFNKHEPRLMRRTSSLNESMDMDRYTQLFEKSLSNKEVKWQSSKSKSLRLTNDDKTQKSRHARMFSRSNLSMPNLEALGFILHEALLETNDMGNNTVESDNDVQSKSASLSLKNDKSTDHFKEAEIDETVEGSGRDVNPSPRSLSDKMVEKIVEGVTCDTREDLSEPASEQEGKESNTRGSNASVPAAEDTNKSLENHILQFKSYSETDSNFKYVKDILEYSGFTRNEQTQMRYTVDQPIKPSLFTALEESLLHENEYSGEENTNIYDHQLLFNLINEVLFQIYEKSPTYFPKPFAFNYKLKSMPKGNNLVNEVWDNVSSYLSLRPELDETLDDVVGRDLTKGSGWMNLQQEEECVALELEEMIIDDLLDEIIFS